MLRVIARALCCTSLATAVLVGALITGCDTAPTDTGDDGDEPIGEAQSLQTVAQARASSCSTISVKGLSEEIIKKGNCIAPGAFVKIPSLPNVTMLDTVFPYLEQPAHDAFVATANANPSKSMTVNSMLRALPQQYLLYHWYLSGTCGIGLAAAPGNSNHETGLAFDTSQYSTWKSALTSHGFKWFGSADTVHFDYTGAGATSYKGTDILAFQELWNEHHPTDTIAEDGDYGPATEAKLAASPAEGWGDDIVCDTPTSGPEIAMTIGYADAGDTFSDGASEGAADLYVGDAHKLQITFANDGDEKATDVVIGVELDQANLSATDYLIESDWMNDGAFQENEANTAAANPAHASALGHAFSLDIHALSPGETKRVTLDVDALAYSVEADASPSVRVFVKTIPDVYDEDAYGGTVDDHGKTPVFNGGRLEAEQPTDVYDRARWEWSSERREGFTASDGATLSVDGDTLTLAGGSAGAFARSPDTGFDAKTAPVISLRAKRTGGAGEARIAFLVDTTTAIAEAPSFGLALPADGAFHEIAIDTSTDARFAGSIHGLAVVPFSDAPGTLTLDYLRAGDGSSPEPGDSVPPGDDGGPSDLGGACSCEVGASRQAGGEWVGLAALAAAVARVRRRPVACRSRA